MLSTEASASSQSPSTSNSVITDQNSDQHTTSHVESQKQTLLLEAARIGNSRQLRQLILEGIDGNEVPEKELKCQGLSALHLAVRHDHPKCVELLLNSGADVNVTDNFGFRPIHDAALLGHVECLESLLEHGANTRGIQQNGMENITPLFYAIQQNHVDCVNMLLQKRTSNHDLLFWDLASKRGTSSDILELLKNKDLPEGRVTTWMKNSVLSGDTNFLAKTKEYLNRELNDAENKILLITSAQHGQKDCLQFLVQSGTDINLKDETGNTALHHACRYGHDGFIDELIKNGASLSLKNDDKYTPFHIAVRRNEIDTIKKLIEVGVDINAKGGKDEETPLHMAIKIGDENTIETLLEAKPDLTITDRKHNTVLQSPDLKGSAKEAVMKYVRN